MQASVPRATLLAPEALKKYNSFKHLLVCVCVVCVSVHVPVYVYCEDKLMCMLV